MKQPHSFFFIETQFDNLGDALINIEQIQYMQKYSKVYLGMRDVPEKFVSKLGKDKLEKSIINKKDSRTTFLLRIFFYRLKGENCYVFLSPGGWIGEIDGRLNIRTWLHTLIYFLLSLLNVKICQVGVSYEDLGPKLLRFLKLRSVAMYKHYVRDAGSKTYAEDHGIRIDGIIPDYAFSNFQKTRSLNEAITFSFRSDQYLTQFEDIKILVSNIVEIVNDTKKVYIVSQVEKDFKTNENLKNWINEKYALKIKHDFSYESIERTKRFYKRSNVIVSNRLHSLLLAGSVGNSMIAGPINEHNKKIKFLFADTGLDKHIFERHITKETYYDVSNSFYNAENEKQALENGFDMIFGNKNV